MHRILEVAVERNALSDCNFQVGSISGRRQLFRSLCAATDWSNTPERYLSLFFLRLL